MSACAFVRSKSLEYHEILAVCYWGHAADNSANFRCGYVAYLAHPVEKSLRHKMDVHKLTDTQGMSK